jgi:small subunit ribosomal protein S4
MAKAIEAKKKNKRYASPTKIGRRFGTGKDLFDPGKIIPTTSPGKDKSKMRRARETTFGVFLKHRCAVMRLFDIREKSLTKIMKKALKIPGASEDFLVGVLEGRLQNIVRRCGLVPTARAASQLVAHGKVLVNDMVVDIKSFPIKVGDKISFAPSVLKNPHNIAAMEKSELAQSRPPWMTFDKKKGIVTVIDTPCLANTKYLLDIDFSILLQNIGR